MSRSLPDNQYPDRLIGGGVLGVAFRAVQERLKEAFDPKIYKHVAMSPKPTQAEWQDFLARTPLIGVSWWSWGAGQEMNTLFGGPMRFPIFLRTGHRTPEALYLGAGVVPGLMGMTSLAIAMLHGHTVRDVGTAIVRTATSTEMAQWMPTGDATVTLVVDFPNVTLDFREILDQLPQFKTLTSTVTLDGDGQPLSSLDIGDA